MGRKQVQSFKSEMTVAWTKRMKLEEGGLIQKKLRRQKRQDFHNAAACPL